MITVAEEGHSRKLQRFPCIKSIPNWLRENIHIFFNTLSETVAAPVGVITRCSVNSKRFFDTLISGKCVSRLEHFSFPFFPFFQNVALQPNSVHLNGRFINV